MKIIILDCLTFHYRRHLHERFRVPGEECSPSSAGVSAEQRDPGVRPEENVRESSEQREPHRLHLRQQLTLRDGLLPAGAGPLVRGPPRCADDRDLPHRELSLHVTREELGAGAHLEEAGARPEERQHRLAGSEPQRCDPGHGGGRHPHDREGFPGPGLPGGSPWGHRAHLEVEGGDQETDQDRGEPPAHTRPTQEPGLAGPPRRHGGEIPRNQERSRDQL